MNILRKLRHPELVILLVVCLLVGMLTLRDYGESWDELQFYKYADHAIASYASSLQSDSVILTGNTYDNYGPAFVMFNSLAAAGLHALLPFLLVSDLRHFIYFLLFLAGVAAFYLLARRWMSPWAAFAATLLYTTQPVFWGQAFISPKDVPFLSAVLISLALGLHMADRELMLTGAPRRSLAWLTGIWVLTLVFLFGTPQILDGLLVSLIQNANAESASWLGALLRNLSSSFGRAEVGIYVQRALVLLLWLKLIYLAVSTALLAWRYRQEYPQIFQLFQPAVVLAGVALGLTISIRILGPIVWAMVALYAWHKNRGRALPLLGVYAALALVAMLITWPYLWADPLGRLTESLRVMAQYPWKGQVFFNGNYYASTNLPLTYLPVLLLLQLTEPVWALCLLGLLALKKQAYLLVICAVWFLLPLDLFIFMRAPLYDNFRQILFILPPVFFCGGLALDWLFARLTQGPARALIITLLVLPGLLAALQLHPYEYIYYNSFIGGVHGAQGRFELDYWATSYRAAMQYVNGVAPGNSRVFVAGPSYLAAIYARPDLKIFMDSEQHSQTFDYAIITTRDGLDRTDFPSAPVVYTIQRFGAPLTVIKRTGTQP